MNIFDFFKKKIIKEKIDTKESLESEYLTINKNDNIYGFQKKFYMQEERLLKVFGNANTNNIDRLKLIIIADTHNALNEEELINVLKLHYDYDLCILLGDHSDNDIMKILNNIPKEKIYALLGNHDGNYIQNYELNNLNGNMFTIKNTNILGIEGSFKYKPVKFPSFTQEESISFLKDLPRADILFSHDGPFDNERVNNPAHQGLFGITYYLFKNKVKYNIHGHIHEDYNKTLLNGTKEMSLFGIHYIEID